MKYTAQFYDINGKLYTLEIGSGEAQNITLASDPFVTELETSNSHIYKPCKYSSATIRMITDDYRFDLYSSTAQQNKVVLSNDDGVVWVGYVTPNLYSQGYENEFEEIEVEAIDALSTLQYYKYDTISDKKEVVSLVQIIDYLLSKCNAYDSYYISDNMQIDAMSDFCLPSKLYISEQNFFDEDDEAMTMQEVLEEICKYLNVTAIADGNSVYFLDYDAIKAGINTYYKYTIGDVNSSTKVFLEQIKDIKATDYVENGGQLSLDNVYNKVSVKDSLYSFESIIPSIWDETYLENYGGEWAYVQEVNEEFKEDKYKCFYKYYKNKNYKSYYYNKDTRQQVQLDKVDYTATQNYIGATICQHFSEKVTDYNTKYNDINYTDYVLLHLHNRQDNIILPLFQLIVNDTFPSFLGGSTYLIIKGNFLFLDREYKMFMIPGYGNKKDDFDPANLYIKCSLKIGNQWWNGTSWINTETTFKLYFDNNGQTDHCINQTFPIKNNITWNMGLDGEEGYAIPMPDTGKVITGKPTFTLYEPQKVDGSYRCDAVWLSNFDIIAKVQNYQKEAEKDSDTEYSNIIDEEFVNELEDVEMKICTWDNKEANYSAICYSPDKIDYIYLDNVYNKATKQMFRYEEHLIYRLVTQYQTPSIILNLNLQNKFKIYSMITDSCLLDKKFIVDSFNIDYALAKQEIKLIEKK